MNEVSLDRASAAPGEGRFVVTSAATETIRTPAAIEAQLATLNAGACASREQYCQRAPRQIGTRQQRVPPGFSCVVSPPAPFGSLDLHLFPLASTTFGAVGKKAQYPCHHDGSSTSALRKCRHVKKLDTAAGSCGQRATSLRAVLHYALSLSPLPRRYRLAGFPKPALICPRLELGCFIPRAIERRLLVSVLPEPPRLTCLHLR